MPEQILSASGTQYGLIINSSGNINVDVNNPTTIGSYPVQNVAISGMPWVQYSGTLIIGSVSASVDSIYIQSGDNIRLSDSLPIATNLNNPYYSFVYLSSGTSTGVVGSRIGSIVQYIGVGSYVQVLKYSNNNLISIGSWY
jgi:hypothetical protein